MLRPFDVVVTYPPKWPRSLADWALSPVRQEIEDWQKWAGYQDYLCTHCAVAVGTGRLFEFTAPKARFREPRQFLRGARWKQYRYIGEHPVNAPLLRELAHRADGTRYDYFELLDFRVSRLLGIRGRVARLFGLSADTVRVCSPGIAWLTSQAGVPYDLPINAIPPAYWTARPEQWELYNWSRHFDHIHERKAA